MTCHDCVELIALRHEVAELRKALGLAGRASDLVKLRRAYGLTDAEARLVHALYDAGGRTVPTYTLAQVTVRDEALLDGSDALKTHVCNARRKVGYETIETVPGGYAMSHAGRALVRAAMVRAAMVVTPEPQGVEDLV